MCVCVGTGTWGAAALIVSYAWGVAVFGNHVESAAEAVVAVLLLLVGGAGIAVCDDLGEYIQRWYTARGTQHTPGCAASCLLPRAAAAGSVCGRADRNVIVIAPLALPCLTTPGRLL